MLHLITSSCKSLIICSSEQLSPCYRNLDTTVFVSHVNLLHYWGWLLWWEDIRALFVAQPWLMAERVSPVCVQASQGTGVVCLGEGLIFPHPWWVLGFPLTPCPGLLPKCSVSSTSAAETSPGMCSEWNLLSCLSSWRGASLVILIFQVLHFFADSHLLDLEAVPWSYFGNTAFFFFSPYLLLQRKCEGNWSRVQDMMYLLIACIRLKMAPQPNLCIRILSFKIVWRWELYTKGVLSHTCSYFPAFPISTLMFTLFND